MLPCAGAPQDTPCTTASSIGFTLLLAFIEFGITLANHLEILFYGIRCIGSIWQRDTVKSCPLWAMVRPSSQTGSYGSRFIYAVLRCVPCTVFHVPCAVNHVLCAVYHEPCTMYGVCHVPCVLCTVCVVYHVCHAPCTVYRVHCTMCHV